MIQILMFLKVANLLDNIKKVIRSMVKLRMVIKFMEFSSMVYYLGPEH